MLTGSCLCSAVTYQLEQEIDHIVFCHCSKCRKASGSAFNSVTRLATKNFTLLSGQEQIKRYASSAGVWRYFCQHCGSSLYSQRDTNPEEMRLRLGTLDSAVTCDNKLHIFVADKASWWEICDDSPQFPQMLESKK